MKQKLFLPFLLFFIIIVAVGVWYFIVGHVQNEKIAMQLVRKLQYSHITSEPKETSGCGSELGCRNNVALLFPIQDSAETVFTYYTNLLSSEGWHQSNTTYHDTSYLQEDISTTKFEKQMDFDTFDIAIEVTKYHATDTQQGVTIQINY